MQTVIPENIVDVLTLRILPYKPAMPEVQGRLVLLLRQV